VRKKNVEAIYELSPQQQGMLFETLLTGESGVYVEQLTWELRGALDLANFQQAWQHVVERHAILRTAFVWKDQDEPYQVVLRQVTVPLEQHDWLALDLAEQQSRLDSLLQADHQRGFELTKPPLMRLALIQTAPQTHQLVWTFHHILMDGWCHTVVLNEVFAAYLALSNGQALQLEPSRPYGDYVLWLKRQDLAEAQVFWREMLHDCALPTPLGRPADDQPEDDQAFGLHTACLLATTLATLQSLAQQHHLTLSTLVQGVWALMLSRYSGGDDVVFGTTIFSRPSELAERGLMIGLFVVTIPFRVHVPSEATAWSWLADVQERHLELRRFEYCSEGQVHQWTGLPASRPLYESILVFQNFPAGVVDQSPGGLKLAVGKTQHRGAQTKYPLAFLVTPGAEGLNIELVYQRQRLSAAGTDSILTHMLALLERLATDPGIDIQHLLQMIPDDQLPHFKPLRQSTAAELGYVEPRTPLEQMLVDIWREVLNVERIGIHDHFLDIGGHSLLALQLMARVRDVFRVELPLRSFFDAPTVADMARFVAEQQSEESELLDQLLNEIEGLSDAALQDALTDETRLEREGAER
jgi:acyl carrier protein